jgi:nucleoside-diphosphate-sugar epimerase
MYGLESANKTLPHKLLNIQKKSLNRERIFFSKSLRDYIHVNDFVALLLQIINNPKTGIFNVGSGSPISITDMIMIILNRFGMSMENKKKSLANNQYLNIKKLNDTYNYEFKINISNWLNDIEYDDQFLF